MSILFCLLVFFFFRVSEQMGVVGMGKILCRLQSVLLVSRCSDAKGFLVKEKRAAIWDDMKDR